MERVAWKLVNHFIEEAGGRVLEGEALAKEWLGTIYPLVSRDSRHTVVALHITIEYFFQLAREGGDLPQKGSG